MMLLKLLVVTRPRQYERAEDEGDRGLALLKDGPCRTPPRASPHPRLFASLHTWYPLQA